MDTQPKATKKKNNITKFRQDKRLAVAGGVRALALLMMLATVLFAVWRYQDELNLSNFKRLWAYAKASTQGASGFTQYSFEPGMNTVYTPFEMGLAVVGGDTYRFISGLEVSEFSVQLKYSSPAISASDRSLLIYDRGNAGYCIANSYSVLEQASAESPIVSASINRSGAYALVTSESGYRGGVTVYDHRHRLLCKWQTPNYYVMMASVNPHSDGFAALCLRESEGRLQSLVLGYGVKSEEPVYTINLGDSWVYSLKHDKNGNLIIVCDDGLYVYDKTGAQTGVNGFSSSLVMFSHQEESMPLLAFKALTGAGEQVVIRTVDETGQTVFEQTFSGSLRDMDYRNGTGYLLFDHRVVGLDLTGETPQITETQSAGARNVLRTPSGECILVYSDRAERLETAAVPDSQEDLLP